MANAHYLVKVMQTQTANPITVVAPMPESFMYDASSTYDAPYAKGLTGDGMVTNVLAAIGYRATMQALTANLWTGSQESQLSLKLEFQTETDPVQDVRIPILNLLKLATPGVAASTGILTAPGPSFDLSGQNVMSVFSGLGSGGIQSATAVLGGSGTTLGGLVSKLGTMLNLGTSSTNGNNTSTAAATTNAASMTSGAYWKSKLKNNITIKIGNYCYFDSVVITQVQQTFASNFDSVTGWPHHVEVDIQFKPLFMVVQSDLDNIFINPTGQTSQGTPGLGLSLPTSFTLGNSNSLFAS